MTATNTLVLDHGTTTWVGSQGAEVDIRDNKPLTCYGTHLYRCTIGAKRFVNDCNGGNHTGAYSHIYMWTPWTHIESLYG